MAAAAISACWCALWIDSISSPGPALPSRAISARYRADFRLHGVCHDAVANHKVGLLCQLRIRRYANPDYQKIGIDLTTIFNVAPKLTILARISERRCYDIDAGITVSCLENVETGGLATRTSTRRGLDDGDFLTGLCQAGGDFKPYIRHQ